MNEKAPPDPEQNSALQGEATVSPEDENPLTAMRSIIIDAGYKPEEVADEDVGILARHWLGDPTPIDPEGTSLAAGTAFDEIIGVFDRLPGTPSFRVLTQWLYRSLLPKQGAGTMSVPLAVTLWAQGRWSASGNALYVLGKEFNLSVDQDAKRVAILSRLYEKYNDTAQRPD